MKVNLSVIPLILASTVQAWSTPATVTVDTTSGRLSGTQAGGGAHTLTLNLLLTKITCYASGII
jgi:hypothetical protein